MLAQRPSDHDPKMVLVATKWYDQKDGDGASLPPSQKLWE